MTKKELLERVSVRYAGTGSYRVTITYRGKDYNCVSNESTAWDAIRYGERSYYTHRQALQAFYNECKMKNKL